MTRGPRAAFSELKRVFAGYLHEDFVIEHGSARGALHAFLADAAPAEVRRLRREARRLLDKAATLDDRALHDLVAQLGGRWTPPSRQALIEWLTEAAHGDAPTP